MYETMVIPLDGSEVSELVIPYAIEFAKRCGSKVTLLETVESVTEAIATMAPADPVLVTPDTTEAIIEAVEAEQKAAEEYLTGVAAKFKDAGIETSWVVIHGSPGTEIVDYANQVGSKVIAMSSHGRGGLGRALLGSVADHVMHHAKAPVLFVRHLHDGK